MTVILHEGDNRIALQRMIDNGEFVDSVVCDPPYGLKSIVKRFGKEGAAPAKYHKDGAFQRASKGFMGHKWDGSEIENDPAFWSLVYQVMKPGAYLVAFSSPRTYHKMATAIEDAGFIVHPMIGWCYGSGMPKAHDAAKAIDKKLETRTYQPGEYVPATDKALMWQGWAYGGQARKPALEPIFIGQKPFSTKTGAENILLHGVGAVNIDGVRPGKRWPSNLITDGSEDVDALFPKLAGQKGNLKGTEKSKKTSGVYGQFEGRGEFDVHDERGSAMRFFENYGYACWECGDSGVKYYGAMCIGDSPSLEGCPHCDGRAAEPSPFDGVPVFYVPKAGKADREIGEHEVIVFEWEDEIEWVKVNTAASQPRVIAASNMAVVSEWNTMLFGKSTTGLFHQGTTSIIETKTSSTMRSAIWSYWTNSRISASTASVISKMENGSNLVGNAGPFIQSIIITNEKTVFLPGANRVASKTPLRISVSVESSRPSGHATVKPVSLIESLIRHVTPPGGTTLDPFAGSGTAGQAARNGGYRAILMENEKPYAEFIRRRLDLPLSADDMLGEIVRKVRAEDLL